MATGHKREVTPQMLALIEQLREQGETQESIAQKLGVGITWIKENAWPKLEGRLKPQRGRKKPAPRSDKPARLPECLMRPLSRMGLPLTNPPAEWTLDPDRTYRSRERAMARREAPGHAFSHHIDKLRIAASGS